MSNETTTTILQSYGYTIPAWAVCPLTYATNEGLNDQDIVKLTMFEYELDTLVSENNADHYSIEYLSDEPYFSPYNDVNSLGGNVYDAIVHLFGKVDAYKVSALEHALIAALWSSTDNDDEPLDNTFGVTDVKDLGTFRDDLFTFIDIHQEILDRNGINPEQCGHDYWLTSNGHGAGFWDRGHGEDGNTLSEACNTSYDVYVTNNGHLAIS